MFFLGETPWNCPNIKINYQIDISVDFLDVTITNENGLLRTSIYHKPAAEPYILPYTSTHPRHIHRNIPYAALLQLYAKKLGHLIIPVFPYIYVILKLFHILVDSLRRVLSNTIFQYFICSPLEGIRDKYLVFMHITEFFTT